MGRLRTHALLCSLTAAIALGAIAGEATAAKKHSKPVVPKKGTAAQVLFERQVFTEINRVRRNNGLRPLRRAKKLKRAARFHSRYQARINRMTHLGRGGQKFSTRLVRFGYRKNVRMSEVVGMRNTCERGDPKILVRAWMNSPSHRVLLLDRKIRNMGVGVVSRKRCSQTYYTANFGA